MKPFLIICSLLIQSLVYACGGINQQVYSGKIEYRLNPLNPFNCTVTITLDFDINEQLANDSIWIDWGDENVTIIRAVSVMEDSLASANMSGFKIYTHVYSGEHTYAALPADGYYDISFQNEYRINGISNIASGDGINLPMYLMAQVSIDTTTGGLYRPLAFSPLTIGFANFEPYHQNGLEQAGNDDDSIVYSFNTPLETVSNPAPEYLLPDQFCANNGSTNNLFLIDSVIGNVSWMNPCLQGIYCFGTVLSKYRKGHLISAIMREQNIYVSTGFVGGIPDVQVNRLELYPNPVKNILTASFQGILTGNSHSLDIRSLDGRLVIRNIVIKDGKFETDVTQLESGIYFVYFRNADVLFTEKFVKQ